MPQFTHNPPQHVVVDSGELWQVVKPQESTGVAQVKGSKYAQRPEREQTFLEFMATVSDDDDGDESIDTDDELAEQVEPPEVDADQGLIIISLSVDAYPSRNAGLLNSTVVVDQKRSDANQRFMVDARNIIGVTKWNKGTMSYDTIHHLKVNNLLVGRQPERHEYGNILRSILRSLPLFCW